MPVARGAASRHDARLHSTARTRRLLAPAIAVALMAVAGSPALAGTVATKPKGDVVKGKALFRAHCGTCHRLAAARTYGKVGPSLNYGRVSFSLGVWTITNGLSLMPGFKDRLKPAEIRDLAAFLAQATNG